MVKVIVADRKLDCEHLLGQFLDESHYDTLVEEDCDVYAPASSMSDSELNERRIIFKFRKNFFNKEEQDQAYIGLREAATETQNRGLAAGPRKESLGNREWVTEYESDILDYFLDPKASLDGDPIEILKEKHKNKTEKPSTRNNVWGIQAVKKDGFVFNEWKVFS